MTVADTIPKTERQDPGSVSGRMAHHLCAVALGLLSLVLFWGPLNDLVSLSLHDERASHILVIPLISACLIYLRRTQVFPTLRYCPAIGIPLLLIALALWYTFKASWSNPNNADRLSVVGSLIVLVWLATFILCYGLNAFKAAAFPLLFLILMIPMPVVVTNYAVTVLQKGSAEVCYVLFRLMGVPVIRHGFRFSLPGVDVEIAEECSGIHSGLALFIAGLVAQHLFLRRPWQKACFTLFIVPIAIFKNAVRIATISWLGIYVNPGFFYGTLHRQGGLPFSLLSLAMMALLLWFLRLRTDPSFRRPLIPFNAP